MVRDAFVSGILFSINDSAKFLDEFSEEEMIEVIRFASVSGGLATIKKGAMTGLPALREIMERLKREKA